MLHQQRINSGINEAAPSVVYSKWWYLTDSQQCSLSPLHFILKDKMGEVTLEPTRRRRNRACPQGYPQTEMKDYETLQDDQWQMTAWVVPNSCQPLGQFSMSLDLHSLDGSIDSLGTCPHLQDHPLPTTPRGPSLTLTLPKHSLHPNLRYQPGHIR